MSFGQRARILQDAWDTGADDGGLFGDESNDPNLSLNPDTDWSWTSEFLPTLIADNSQLRDLNEEINRYKREMKQEDDAIKRNQDAWKEYYKDREQLRKFYDENLEFRMETDFNRERMKEIDRRNRNTPTPIYSPPGGPIVVA